MVQSWLGLEASREAGAAPGRPLSLTWQIALAVVRPQASPALVEADAEPEGLAGRILVAPLPPAFLILAVLGSILAGIATPTESAAVGALGAIALPGLRGRLRLAVLRQVMRTTTQISSMVSLIMLGASLFSLVFRGLGGNRVVEDALHDLPGGPFGATLAVMALMFVLGFFLDFIEIVRGRADRRDPIWLGVMMAVNLQTSFLTPPFGLAIFYLRGVAPASVRTADIYRGIAPFVLIQLFGLAVLALFPGLATWLPEAIFG